MDLLTIIERYEKLNDKPKLEYLYRYVETTTSPMV